MLPFLLLILLLLLDLVVLKLPLMVLCKLLKMGVKLLLEQFELIVNRVLKVQLYA